MTLKLASLFVLAYSLMFIRCTSERPPRFNDRSYTDSVSFTYHYADSLDIQFTKVFNQGKLKPVNESDFSGIKLQEIYSRDYCITGLNYKESTFYRLDSTLKKKSYSRFVNSSTKKYNILYSHNDCRTGILRIFDLKTQSLIVLDEAKEEKQVLLNNFESEPIYRICEIDSNILFYVRSANKNTDLEFVKLNQCNNEKTIVTSLSKVQTESSVHTRPDYSFDGRFVYGGGRYLIYYCTFNSYFILFDTENLMNPVLVKGITGIPAPRVKEQVITAFKSEKIIEMSPNISFFNWAEVRDSVFYQLSSAGTRNRTIDLYNLNAGARYMGSINVPDYQDTKPISFTFMDGYLYTLYKNQNIVKYEIIHF